MGKRAVSVGCEMDLPVDVFSGVVAALEQTDVGSMREVSKDFYKMVSVSLNALAPAYIKDPSDVCTRCELRRQDGLALNGGLAPISP